MDLTIYTRFTFIIHRVNLMLYRYILLRYLHIAKCIIRHH